MQDWDPDIAELDLDDFEKNGLQQYRNYTRAFQRKRAERIGEDADLVEFDLATFETDLEAIASSGASGAVLSGIAIADDLLLDMFKREKRERLQVDSLLGPLGPLGDFNKRLKVAALVSLIDADDLVFFDELRKIRNGIAHSRRPHSPSSAQIEQLIEAAPHWLEAFETDESLVVENPERHTEAILKASIVMHLSKLAWRSILGPLAQEAQVPISMLLEKPPPIFKQISKVGGVITRRLLKIRPR